MPEKQPLAFRMRPTSFDEFVGQATIAGKGSFLRRAVENGYPFSMILYGPPGSGKTSLAFIITATLKARFIHISAVSSTVKELRSIIAEAKEFLKAEKKTILFIDEIHRFNKAQQDALLPAVEDGTLILIGATTENPFFEVNSPLLSRCHLIVLETLTEDEIREIIRRALVDKRGLAGDFLLSGEVERLIIINSQGDARVALNILESASRVASSDKRKKIIRTDVEKVVKTRVFYYDRERNLHYDLASAFIKSLRASDPDAALAYFARMIEGGEDPKFIARRMVIFASEDIGNADPIAILVAISSFLAVERVGLPECIINLAQGVTYLATAPKSNASYIAVNNAFADIKKTPYLTIPVKLKDTHYSGSKKLGHGIGYHYPHLYEGHFYPETLMPEELRGKTYYKPSEMGYEKKIYERLKKWRELIKEREKKKDK